MGNNESRRFLVAAIIWTVVAAVALVMLLVATGPLFGKICGMALVAMCVVGQWLRYLKSR